MGVCIVYLYVSAPNRIINNQLISLSIYINFNEFIPQISSIPHLIEEHVEFLSFSTEYQVVYDLICSQFTH
jgi:hypothetical protein